MLSKAVGLAGGLYVARKYLRDRLEEVRDKLEIERAAREQSVLEIPLILFHILIFSTVCGDDFIRHKMTRRTLSLRYCPRFLNKLCKLWT